MTFNEINNQRNGVHRCSVTAAPAWCIPSMRTGRDDVSGAASPVCRQRPGGEAARRINPEMKVGCMLAMVPSIPTAVTRTM